MCMIVLVPLARAEESTVRPLNLKIRKVSQEKDQLYLWVYVNSNIKSEVRYDEIDGEFSTMYVYDMTQLKIPLDSDYITEKERGLLSDTMYSQYLIRTRLSEKLKTSVFTDEIKHALTSKTETKQVDQKERFTPVINPTLINASISPLQ